MSTNCHCDNIDSLISQSVSWASQAASGCFYGRSDDNGNIALRISDFIQIDGVFYLGVEVTTVEIPEERRDRGLYKSLLQRLDSLKKFGVRCHPGTQNNWLIKHHKARGYHEEQCTESSTRFYVVIGPPLGAMSQKTHRKLAALPLLHVNRVSWEKGGLIKRRQVPDNQSNEANSS
jgi:hypothetical protein